MVNHSYTGHKAPSHIVVFKQRSNRNVAAIVGVLGLQPTRGFAEPGVVSFRPTTGNRATSLYFPDLRIATLALTQAESDRLKGDPTVLSIHPNRNVRIDLPPATPAPRRFRWRGLRNCWTRLTGAKPLSDALQQIGISSASVISSKGAKVAILDTGIDLTHPDFAGQFTVGNNAKSFVQGLGVQDGHGHGTHCAGIIAGEATTGGSYRFGVAPDAELLVGRVLDDGAVGLASNVIEGINWAVQKGARIISMSFGESRPAGQPPNTDYEELASDLRQNGSGVLLIAAAGNGSNRPAGVEAPVEDPAAASSIMAVAAVTDDNGITHFSCKEMDQYGQIDISAPGESVYSSWKTGTWWTRSGTSMATAHVAGVAALYLANNPQSTADQIQNALESAAQPLGAPADFGAGLVKVPI